MRIQSSSSCDKSSSSQQLSALKLSLAASSEVQSQVLPKFGFRGDMKGVFDMLERSSDCLEMS